jgi:D-beta-D-heptose 7-phosphate kinase/D-beta-D-heptose 1-phosphate adenosyltransferase
MNLTRTRAEELVGGFTSQRILIAGDLMLDRYIYGEVSRISPEAPVPVVRVCREQAMPGGAANVALNIRALGGEAVMAGVVGEDPAGDELCRVLEAGEIDVGGIVRSEERQTTVKTRIIAERQQVVRIDREDPDGLSEPLGAQLHEAATRSSAGASGIILEDYGKGALTQSLVDSILGSAADEGIPVGYDPTAERSLRVDGVTIATPNRKEAFGLSGAPEVAPREDPTADDPLLEVAATLRESWHPRALLITLGSHGMLLVTDDSPPFHVPTHAREVFDVSGAGDTVIATCLLAIASGATPREAAVLANYAAGVVVGKLGTACCSPEDLLVRIE